MPAVVKDVSQPSPFATSIHSYADDTQIHTSGKISDLPAVLHQIKEDTNIIIDWLTKNKLKANPTKFKYMLIGTPIMLSKIPENHKEIQIKGATLPCVSEAKNLGVTFDSSLKWDHHIEDVRKRCNGKLIALSYLRNMMSEKTFASVVQATALSVINYCDLVYGNAAQCVLSKLQKSQNFAARIVTGVRKYDHVSPALVRLNWVPLKERRLEHRLNFMHKCVNGAAPVYLSDCFRRNDEIHSYNTRNRLLLTLPRALSNSGQRNFLYKGVSDFNKLPNNIRNEPNYKKYKSAVYSHVRTSFDNQ